MTQQSSPSTSQSSRSTSPSGPRRSRPRSSWRWFLSGPRPPRVRRSIVEISFNEEVDDGERDEPDRGPHGPPAPAARRGNRKECSREQPQSEGRLYRAKERGNGQLDFGSGRLCGDIENPARNVRGRDGKQRGEQDDECGPRSPRGREGRYDDEASFQEPMDDGRAHGSGVDPNGGHDPWDEARA